MCCHTFSGDVENGFTHTSIYTHVCVCLCVWFCVYKFTFWGLYIYNQEHPFTYVGYSFVFFRVLVRKKYIRSAGVRVWNWCQKELELFSCESFWVMVNGFQVQYRPHLSTDLWLTIDKAYYCFCQNRHLATAIQHKSLFSINFYESNVLILDKTTLCLHEFVLKCVFNREYSIKDGNHTDGTHTYAPSTQHTWRARARACVIKIF